MIGDGFAEQALRVCLGAVVHDTLILLLSLSPRLLHFHFHFPVIMLSVCGKAETRP